jgi:hypothetical protein
VLLLAVAITINVFIAWHGMTQAEEDQQDWDGQERDKGGGGSQ